MERKELNGEKGWPHGKKIGRHGTVEEIVLGDYRAGKMRRVRVYEHVYDKVGKSKT